MLHNNKIPRVFLLPDALEELGIKPTSWNEKWLKKAIKSNTIPYHKTGHKWLITEENLLELLKRTEKGCLNLQNQKRVDTTKFTTRFFSQQDKLSESEKLQDALRMKTLKSLPQSEKEKLLKNSKVIKLKS